MVPNVKLKTISGHRKHKSEMPVLQTYDRVSLIKIAVSVSASEIGCLSR